MNRTLAVSALIILGVFTTVFGQNTDNKNSSDRALHGSGRINASTLGMEIDIPFGGYTGRGINVPINLSYSSKLWRMDSDGFQPVAGGNYSSCYANYLARYAEESAAGWTSSLAVPFIEYTGGKNFYNFDGTPISYSDVQCPESGGGGGSNAYYYIRRLTVHLPSGETHELRADDTQIAFSSSGNSDPNGPYQSYMWNATFYATDGSNVKYIQNSANNTYRLLMPDGSFYDFDAGTSQGADRKAVKFTDRNGNFTTYYAPGSVDDQNVTHPNGYWKDTLGRNISIPLAPQAPTVPTTAANPQVYAMPGMTGTYKLHWKKLKDNTAGESALTDFSQNLKPIGDTYLCYNSQGFPAICVYPAGVSLFSGGGNSTGPRINNPTIFNPVVLAEIELPTGQKYKFSYDIYGRIEKIIYPTGGEELFQYSVVPTLSTLEPDNLVSLTNFGVTDRKVYPTAGQTANYHWTYSANYVSPQGYQVTTNNPDGTRSERILHQGNDMNVISQFGYDNALAGMAYEVKSYDNSNPRKIVSKKLTSWTKKSFGNADWHPRVTQEESIIYDPTGNGVSATAKYEYEGDLNQRETPVLTKKSLQYAFVTAGSALPSTPVRSSETTFLINDANYPQWVKDIYKAQNMIGLATVSVVKDGAGTIVSQSEMAYDESGYSPNVGRGNPTTARVWDSTKGASTSSSAYIATHAKFDIYGNQYEAIDAKGNSTTTEFDATYHAFPIKVTSAVPDPTGINGSNTAFETTATYNTTTGLPLTTTDANGLETRITYDAATLRPLNVKVYYQNNQVGGTAETVYHDELNNYWVKSRQQTDTNVWAESLSYFDGLGRAYKAEEVNSQGNIFVEKEFDAQGRVSRVTNPFRSGETKIWTTNVYDESSRIKEVVLPDGAKVKTDYGVSTASGFIGVTKTITDQADKKRKGISDALGRMIRVIEDPTGQNLPTDYVFDTLGNLRKTTQGEQSRYFTHDSLGRLLYAKQPEQQANTSFSYTDSITGNTSWSVKYEYDDNGNITSTTNAEGVSVTGTYDNFNRLKLRNYSDSTPDVDFFYDGKYLNINDQPQTASGSAKGKTTGVKSSVSRTNYTSFDNVGRLLTNQQITDGQTYQTSYEYDAFGKLLTETYPSGRTVKMDYNQDGDVSSIWGTVGTQNRLYVNSISYNSSGAIERLRLGNGKWETTAYNNRLQVTEIGLGNSATDKSLLKLEYDYGTNTQNNGSLRSQKISFSGLSQPFEQTYIYDDLNRLQSAEEKVSNATTWKQTFVYDRYGNRRFDAANTTTLSASNNVTNPTIDTATNRFSSGQNYSYDKDGNLTVDAENRRFVYDAENHQTQLFASNNSSSTPDATYHYDGEGRRVKKISSTETTVFVYDGGGQLVAEYSTQLAETPQVSYLTADHLGSPRVITNENGVVTTRKDYMAFGEETYTAQRTSPLNYDNQSETRKGYTGYEKDDESGLDFAQARYYNSKHGRYTSVDPLTASANIKNPQTFNRYSYVLNSPYKFTDPLGLISENAGSPCGTRCANSGGFVDGSAFRGTDSTFDSLKTINELNNEWWAAIVAVSAGISDEMIMASINSRSAASPPPPTAEQNEDDGYNYANVSITVGDGRLVDKKGLSIDENGNEFEITYQQWEYPIEFYLYNPDGSPVPDYTYEIGKTNFFGDRDIKGSNQPMIYSVTAEADPDYENKSNYKIWVRPNNPQVPESEISFRLEAKGINISLVRFAPLSVPISRKPGLSVFPCLTFRGSSEKFMLQVLNR